DVCSSDLLVGGAVLLVSVGADEEDVDRVVELVGAFFLGQHRIDVVLNHVGTQRAVIRVCGGDHDGHDKGQARRDPQNDAAATTAAPQPLLSQGGGFSVFVVVLGVFLRRVFGFFRVRALVVRGLPGGVRFLAVRSLLGLHTLWVLSGHIITLSVGHGVDGFVGDLVGVAVFSAGRVRVRGGAVVSGAMRPIRGCRVRRGA